MKAGKKTVLALLALALALAIDLYHKDERPAEQKKASVKEDAGDRVKGNENNENKDAVSEVSHVIDGDTIRLKDGTTVRYIGIDTPEKGRPFYNVAKKRNKELLKGRTITLRICPENPKDKYGRTLAWVYADSVFVNEALLREGLARALIIPPCGSQMKARFRAIERRAREEKAGMWSYGEATTQRLF